MVAYAKKWELQLDFDGNPQISLLLSCTGHRYTQNSRSARIFLLPPLPGRSSSSACHLVPSSAITRSYGEMATTFDEAVSAFLRNPVSERYSVASKQQLSAVRDQCAADLSTTCASIPVSGYDLAAMTLPSPAGKGPCKLGGHHHEHATDSHHDHTDHADHVGGHHEKHHRGRRLQGRPEYAGGERDDRAEEGKNREEKVGDRHDRGAARDHVIDPRRRDEMRFIAFGFGPQGDSCMVNSLESLSPNCRGAMLDLQDLQHRYWQDSQPRPGWDHDGDHPHFPVFLIVGLALLAISLALCVFRCLGLRSRRSVVKEQTRNLVIAIGSNVALKSHVEMSTGLPVPDLLQRSSFFSWAPTPTQTYTAAVHDATPSAPPMRNVEPAAGTRVVVV